jgi:hypothetical protein
MPPFLLVRQRCRRARRLSVVRAVAVGWARLGDKSLFHQWWANANRKRAGRGAHSCQSVAIGGIWVQCFGDRAQKPRAPAWWECRRAALDKGALLRCQGQWIVGHS